ncbi:MAG: ABC transporter ATP-binding protein [Candidatus Eremiobacteraeota bacterium]|nr:ABC transporter ATP-binding protein [Candidatus Eremiobacteraeota bacterium]
MTLSVDMDVLAGSFPVSCQLQAAAGAPVAIVGLSGAGKTTVLRGIAGLARAARGSIVCDDEVWFDSQTAGWVPPQNRDCGFVFADAALFGHMSAFENVAFGLRARGDRTAILNQRAMQALELVGVAGLAKRRASSLSTGEAQRVAIARALALDPRVLLLDEPLGAIDVEHRTPVREALLRAIAEREMIAVIVSHDPAEAALFSDSLLVMEAGSVVQRGTPAELREHPLTRYVAAFAGVNLYRGVASPVQGGVSEVDVDGSMFTILGTASGPVALVIDPDAVVLSRERPSSSARNWLVGNVAAVVADGPSLRVSIASTPSIVARITRRSADELGCVPGATLHATFKASEVRVH